MVIFVKKRPVAADLKSDAIENRDFKSLYSLLRITNPQQLYIYPSVPDTLWCNVEIRV